MVALQNQATLTSAGVSHQPTKTNQMARTASDRWVTFDGTTRRRKSVPERSP
jgi:hypothetical protein